MLRKGLDFVLWLLGWVVAALIAGLLLGLLNIAFREYDWRVFVAIPVLVLALGLIGALWSKFKNR
jgi:MFS family permease